MRLPLALLLAALAGSASAISTGAAAPKAACKELGPAAKTLVEKLKLDAGQACLAAKDGEISSADSTGRHVTVYSLEKLAADGDEQGARSFIVMRSFAAELKAHFDKTTIPSENYDGAYLTADERAMAGERLAQVLAALQH